MVKLYECERCGSCCGGLGPIIEADIVDAARESRIPIACERQNETMQPETWMWSLQRDNETPCRFLVRDSEDGASLCSLYDTRPDACVCFAAGSKQCEKVREIANLKPLEPIEVSDPSISELVRDGLLQFADRQTPQARPPTVHGRNQRGTKTKIGGASVIHNTAQAVSQVMKMVTAQRTNGNPAKGPGFQSKRTRNKPRKSTRGKRRRRR